MKEGYRLLGDFIRQVDVRNTDGKEENLLGVSVQKMFIPSIANTVGTDFTKYKVVKRGQFTYIPDTSRRGDKIGIALLTDYDEGLVSNIYTVFEVKDENELLPEYLMLWFSRPEFDRYARFKSHGSVREIMDWDEMCKVKLPVPSIEKQRSIVKAYNTITDRIELKRKINDNLEATIQAAFDKAFHDAGVSLPETIIKQNKVPQGWTDATVGDFASVQTGPFGSQLHNEDYVESGTPIITVEHMDGKYIAHRNLPLVSQNDVDRLRKYDLHTGDIVFSRVGSVDRAVMVSQHEDGWLFSGRCLRVRPYDPNTGSYFLWWFNQPVIRQLVTASAVGATMPSINTSILNSIRIVFPQKDIVTQFCKMADGLIEIIATNLEEIRKLNDAREYIQLSLSR
ncbi:restriction endonuclease subunit S [Roseburia intestinalis]|jgi:restriction endonuclease S subunit